MFTLPECITRINQVLNYPAVSYVDVSHFFDQAISELNTTFKIGIPSVTQMIDENRINIQELSNLTFIRTLPTGTDKDIPVSDPSGFKDISKVYFNPEDYKVYKYDTVSANWVGFDKMYGLYISSSGQRTLYETVTIFGIAAAVWAVVEESGVSNLDLNTYLPTDWIILFIIPYVCAKLAVRDGVVGDVYNEEYIQGFQQIQTSYDVPNFVKLADVAHLPAYSPVVESNLNNTVNLLSRIPTRAVYDTMKRGDAIKPQYGGFYTTGGWGL